MDCLFCKIIKGQLPTQKVYEDKDVIAIKDIHPKAPVHYLFIPKEHVESLAALPATNISIMAKIFAAIKIVADKEGISGPGYRTVINTNQEGGQVIFHLHVHFMAGRQMDSNVTEI